MVFQSQIIVIMYVHKLHLKRILQPLLGFAATQKSKTPPQKRGKTRPWRDQIWRVETDRAREEKAGCLDLPSTQGTQWQMKGFFFKIRNSKEPIILLVPSQHPGWRVDIIHVVSFVQIGGEILHVWDYRDYIRPLEGFFPTKQYNLMAKRSGDEHAHSVVKCWRILTEMWKEHRNVGNLNMWMDQWFRMLFRESASRVSEKMTSRIQLWRGVRQDSKWEFIVHNLEGSPLFGEVVPFD